MFIRFRAFRARLGRLLRPPRRIRARKAGVLVIVATFALGLATLNTGNNLLYLLLGALLGLIALSGWLSEQCLKPLSVERRVPRGIEAGSPVRLTYRISRATSGLPSYLVRIREAAPGAVAFAPLVPSLGSVTARAQVTFPHRGVYSLPSVTVGTTFPFGFFEKERDIECPGSVVVWPRTGRQVRHPRPAGDTSRARAGPVAAGGGERGEFRGLRPYRPGDDPRDIHWRSSARLREPVVRQYDRDSGELYWICLRIGHASKEAAEIAIEIAAALAVRAARQGDRFGLAAGARRLSPGGGTGQLEAVLDALAELSPADARRLAPPAPPEECVLVTDSAAPAPEFGEVYRATDGS